MRVKFNQAVHLHGKDYTRGVHEVPDAHLNHKHFHKMLKNGLVEDGEKVPVKAQTLAERQAGLAERIAKKNAPAPGPSQANPKTGLAMSQPQGIAEGGPMGPGSQNVGPSGVEAKDIGIPQMGTSEADELAGDQAETQIGSEDGQPVDETMDDMPDDGAPTDDLDGHRKKKKKHSSSR